MITYYNCIYDDCFVYSIDMVRFQTYLFDTELIDYLRSFLDYSGLNYFPDKGFGHFVDNYKGSHFWVGVGSFNSNKSGLNVTIEFNPNKCTEEDFTFIFRLFKLLPDLKLIRFDLAIDIPYSIDTLFFGSLFKKSYSVFFTSSTDLTYYFGKGDGHTKIYNKTIESNLDYPLTRYEVTKNCSIALDTSSAIEPIDFHFIEITRQPYTCFSSFDSDSETLKAVLFAINHGYPYKELSRRYKDIIKKDYEGLFFLSNTTGNNCLLSFLKKFKSRYI